MTFNKLTLLILFVGASAFAADQKQQPPRSEDEAKRSAAFTEQRNQLAGLPAASAAPAGATASTAQEARAHHTQAAPSQVGELVGAGIVYIYEKCDNPGCSQGGVHLVQIATASPQVLALFKLQSMMREMQQRPDSDGQDDQ